MLSGSEAGRAQASALRMHLYPLQPTRTSGRLVYPSNQSVDINRNQASRGLQNKPLDRLLRL
jgi:hypothetical protein